MKKHLNQKGFTLIEIIVVVVILAILAALILPRFLGQTERPVIAEAQENLGALRRAQITRSDTTGLGYLACTGAGGLCVLADYQALGMQTPAAGARFTYVCAGVGAAGACTATRVGAVAAAAGSTGTIAINLDTGVFACAGGATGYVLVDPANPDRGCTTA